jgi:hypothetical protein
MAALQAAIQTIQIRSYGSFDGEPSLIH